MCKGSKVKVAQLKKYDQAILLSADEIEASEQTHLAFGKPACGRYLYQRESVICYDVKRRVPVWAIYRLQKKDVISKERRDSFLIWAAS